MFSNQRYRLNELHFAIFILIISYSLLSHSFFLSDNIKRAPNTRLLLAKTVDDCKHLVIWDCDGVLVDSEALLKQGEVEALERLGFHLSVDDCVRLFSGVSPDTAAENFLKEYSKPLPGDFFKEQIAGSMDLFRRRLTPLMYDTVAGLHSQGTAMCVASGSPRSRVSLCLEVAKMQPFFSEQSVFTRELVSRGKPAPDLFLYAAEKMKYPAAACIVVEDSSAGIEAALAANMEVIGYLGGGHAKADWYRKVVRSYAIPVVETPQEVFQLIQERLCSL